ncbi:MAG: DUF2089 family protein [Phycisphaerales bacterium]|nr:DUF2089 family protein [Phycisphaerales bacterium]
MAFDSLTPVASHAAGTPPGRAAHPLAALDPDDLDFICRLVLESGSLKGLAASYGVSYPTIRARLDRVIERLRGVLAGRPVDPLAELLAGMVERGAMSATDARRVLDAADKREASTTGSPGA